MTASWHKALRYFLWCAWTGRQQWILDYHRAQTDLYGWTYLWGVRRLRPDWRERQARRSGVNPKLHYRRSK